MDGAVLDPMPQSQSIAIVNTNGKRNESLMQAAGILHRNKETVACHPSWFADECPGHQAATEENSPGSVSGSGSSKSNKELSFDLEEASNVIIVTADRVTDDKKIVSFAAVASDSNAAESAQLKDTTKQQKTQRQQQHLEPSLPMHIIAVQNRPGRDETTISTLSFGQKPPVLVETPRETPWFYVGIVLALIVSTSSAFLIAFLLALR